MSSILTLEQAILAREKTRMAGMTLVFTNGHFDLLHVGHLDYLERARSLGGALFVGINSDHSTGLLKGPGRPITPAIERARLVAALRCVDAVLIFHEPTANRVIEALRPEVYVKGGDYHHKDLPERPIVESYGGRVVLIDMVPERSTTQLITRIKALPDATAPEAQRVAGEPDDHTRHRD